MDRKDYEALRASLKAGVKAVSAPCLFPTPPALARRMVALAELRPGMTVLEPSAGTGRLLDALQEMTAGFHPSLKVKAVEINVQLAHRLKGKTEFLSVTTMDFLSIKFFGSGPFDRVLMNPPFDHGSDIEHILHALKFLKPDGLLVGICANGPVQEKRLAHLCEFWEELPAGTFQGTNVRSVLFTIRT